MVQAVDQYLELTGLKLGDLKRVSTPFVSDTSISDSMYEDNGELQPHACSLLMKVLYGARYARPDLIRPVNLLSRRVTKWRRVDDVRLHRLF